MASCNKFEEFVYQLFKGVHQLHAAGHQIEVFLTNEQPLAADAVKADMVEITIENGYTGPEDTQNDVTESPAGTANLTCVSIQIVATGDIGPFQFVVMFNQDATSPLDAVIAWWDYGEAITLHDTETFDINFAATTLQNT